HTRFSRDWSSDVCSSDLIVLLKALEEAAEIAVELGSFPPDLDKLRGDEDEVLARLREASASEAAKLEACEAELAAVLRALDGNEIGRASCRESVEILGLS